MKTNNKFLLLALATLTCATSVFGMKRKNFELPPVSVDEEVEEEGEILEQNKKEIQKILLLALISNDQRRNCYYIKESISDDERLKIIKPIIEKYPNFANQDFCSIEDYIQDYSEGKLPIHYAAENCNSEKLVRFFVEKCGAKVDCFTKIKPKICYKGSLNEKEAERLEKWYNDPKNWIYSTPLYFAATSGNPEAVKYLLNKGANPQAKHKNGKETILKKIEQFSHDDYKIKEANDYLKEDHDYKSLFKYDGKCQTCRACLDKHDRENLMGRSKVELFPKNFMEACLKITNEQLQRKNDRIEYKKNFEKILEIMKQHIQNK